MIEPKISEGAMSRNTEGIIKGIMLGMAVGAVAYIMSSDSTKKMRKRCKKGAARAVRTARELVDEVGYMLR